eukprot:1193315-Prorocentrum_minimum.AAC.7
MRRDYDWGKWATEAWQQTSASKPYDPINGWISYDDVNLRGDRTRTDVGTGSVNGGFTSRPELDMFYPELSDFNDNGESGEVFYMRFPPYDGDGDTNTAQEFHQCPGPFYCDYLKTGCTKKDYDEAAATAANDYLFNHVVTPTCGFDDTWNPPLCGVWANKRFDGGVLITDGEWTLANYDLPGGRTDGFGAAGTKACGRWADMFGMYMGDGSVRTVVLKSTEIDYSCLPANAGGDGDCNSITGNYIMGRENFQHIYKVRRPPGRSLTPCVCFLDERSRAPGGMGDRRNVRLLPCHRLFLGCILVHIYIFGNDPPWTIRLHAVRQALDMPGSTATEYVRSCVRRRQFSVFL